MPGTKQALTSVVKTLPANAGELRERHRFNPWVRKIPWRRAWQPTPVLLPVKSYGQRSLVSYSPWGSKELDTMEVTWHAQWWLCHGREQERWRKLRVGMSVLSRFTHIQLFVTSWTVAHQAPLSMRFSSQEYWNGLPFPSPWDLPGPGIEPKSLCLLHWQEGSLPLEPLGSPVGWGR